MTVQKAMNTVTQFITQVGPHLLPVASILFSVIGLLTMEMGYLQVASLTFVLVIFSGLLSESLKKYLEVRHENKFRAWTLAILAVGLFILDVVLVHAGQVWVFQGLMSGIAVWFSAFFFSLLVVFSKYAFIETIDEDTEMVAEATKKLKKINAMIGLTGSATPIEDSLKRKRRKSKK